MARKCTSYGFSQHNTLLHVSLKQGMYRPCELHNPTKLSEIWPVSRSNDPDCVSVSQLSGKVRLVLITLLLHPIFQALSSLH
jgi:hypothetical protein